MLDHVFYRLYSCPAIFEVPLYLIIDRISDSCAGAQIVRDSSVVGRQRNLGLGLRTLHSWRLHSNLVEISFTAENTCWTKQMKWKYNNITKEIQIKCDMAFHYLLPCQISSKFRQPFHCFSTSCTSELLLPLNKEYVKKGSS
jgi:hypothetical protein